MNVKAKFRVLIVFLLLFQSFLIDSNSQKEYANKSKSINYKPKLSTSLTNYTMNPSNPYNWIDAKTGGKNPVFNGNNYNLTTLPFTFPYYNGSYTAVYITKKGYLTFVNPNPIPNSNPPSIPNSNSQYRYLIAPYWAYLVNNQPTKVYFKSFGTYWAVAWINITYNNAPAVYSGVFEVVLYNNGDIVFNYDYLASVGGAQHPYRCCLNYGMNINYYNSYSSLSSSTNDFSIKFYIPSDSTSDDDDDTSDDDSTSKSNEIIASNALTIIIVLGVIGIGSVAGIALFYYIRNPSLFKASMQVKKGKFKHGIQSLTDKFRRLFRHRR